MFLVFQFHLEKLKYIYKVLWNENFVSKNDVNYGIVHLCRWKEQESYVDSLLAKLENSSAEDVAK